MDWKRLLAVLIGLILVAVWFPLLVAGIATLHSRGRLGESDVLITSGPYARVRHPLYAGLSLAAAGMGLIIGARALVLGGLGWLLLTRLWSIPEERGLAERFGEEYAKYRLATPAFVPRVCQVVRSSARTD